MRILAAADLHGNLPPVEECDLLLLAGDILPDDDQERWAVGPFREWLLEIPAREVVAIAGNHDFYMETAGWSRVWPHLRLQYLQDSGTQIDGVRIWGTPWTENLVGWAFAAEKDEAREKFALVPEDTDILLSHAPPSGILDRVGGEHVGSVALGSALQRVAPRHLVCGHIHECGGEQETLGKTTFTNASLLDESYQLRREPFSLE